MLPVRDLIQQIDADRALPVFGAEDLGEDRVDALEPGSGDLDLLLGERVGLEQEAEVLGRVRLHREMDAGWSRRHLIEAAAEDERHLAELDWIVGAQDARRGDTFIAYPRAVAAVEIDQHPVSTDGAQHGVETRHRRAAEADIVPLGAAYCGHCLEMMAHAVRPFEPEQRRPARA